MCTKTFDQQLPRELDQCCKRRQESVQRRLVHCVKDVKNLEKNERSEAQVERFGSAELAEIRALIPETIFMQLRKLSCFS